MKMKPYYVCEICGNAYKNVKSAELCEKTHLKGIYEKSEYRCGNTVPTSIVVSFEGDEWVPGSGWVRVRINGTLQYFKLDKIDFDFDFIGE